MDLRQPRLLALLSFAQMGKFFSQFGVRSLFVLFLVQSLHYSDTHAFGIAAALAGVGTLMGIFGGIIADRYLGLRRSVTLGGLLLGSGYVLLFFNNGLFPAIALMSLGGSLFSTNISALLGTAYSENDPRRKKGFTIFYVVQNIGALVSTLICGVIATHFGFPAGFAVAALGMIAANVALFWYRDLLPPHEVPQKKGKTLLFAPVFLLIPALALLAIYWEGVTLSILPWVSGGVFLLFALKLLKDPEIPKKKIYKLLIYLGGMILFFAAEDQISSSLMVFTERMVDRTFFGWTIPSAEIMSINPIVVILFGMMIAKLRSPLITPFLFAALSFGGLAFFCLLHLGVSFFGIIGMVALLSLGELMIAPLLSSTISEVAVKGKVGTMMGIIPIAASLSSLLGGGFSKMVALAPAYGAGFGHIALIVLAGGVVLQLLLSWHKSSRPLFS